MVGKKVKFKGQSRILFINIGQSFHYLPNTYKERKEFYKERDKEWFKV